MAAMLDSRHRQLGEIDQEEPAHREVVNIESCGDCRKPIAIAQIAGIGASGFARRRHTNPITAPKMTCALIVTTTKVVVTGMPNVFAYGVSSSVASIPVAMTMPHIHDRRAALPINAR